MVTNIFSIISLLLSISALKLSWDNKKTISSQHEQILKRDRIENVVKAYIKLWSEAKDTHIHALSIAGAANLHSDDELNEACILIENQAGAGHPLTEKQKKQIQEVSILKFFKEYALMRDEGIPVEKIITKIKLV